MALETTERVYEAHPYADAFKAQIALRDATRRGDTRSLHFARKARKRVTVALLRAAVRG